MRTHTPPHESRTDPSAWSSAYELICRQWCLVLPACHHTVWRLFVHSTCHWRCLTMLCKPCIRTPGNPIPDVEMIINPTDKTSKFASGRQQKNKDGALAGSSRSCYVFVCACVCARCAVGVPHTSGTLWLTVALCPGPGKALRSAPLFCNVKCKGDTSISFPLYYHALYGMSDGQMSLVRPVDSPAAPLPSLSLLFNMFGGRDGVGGTMRAFAVYAFKFAFARARVCVCVCVCVRGRAFVACLMNVPELHPILIMHGYTHLHAWPNRTCTKKSTRNCTKWAQVGYLYLALLWLRKVARPASKCWRATA